MIEWRDEAILLSTRPHGERDAIVEALTSRRGRHLGLVRGGATRRRAADLQPGAQLTLTWRARLEGHLGVFQLEATRLRASRVLGDAFALAGLTAATALLSSLTAEREPQPALYAAAQAFFDALGDSELWPGMYAAFELKLLEALGFGLDLSACAATGSAQELIYVSPRSGRAVSRAAGAPYAPRLLPLPTPLRLEGPCDPAEFRDALKTTGFFLEKWALPALERPGLPPARARLAALAADRSDGSDGGGVSGA